LSLPSDSSDTNEPSGRPAFYALAPGGWRDWWTLLHPPYTAWMLSYVVFGALTAAALDGYLMFLTLCGFFLGVGVAAHALDELSGRPLRTKISDGALWTVALMALGGAAALGVYGGFLVSWWIVPFIVFGLFIVIAYNLELFGGAFHSNRWFAVAWGAFPALTGAFAQTGTLSWEAAAIAVACALLSSAQRMLSTPVRRLRRDVAGVEGILTFSDGDTETFGEEALRGPSEAALRTTALALPLLAAGLAAGRLI